VIPLYELDLRDPSSELPGSIAPSWVLIRDGDRVLGEVRCDAGDPRTPVEVRAHALRTFGALLDARDALTLAEADSDLGPDDVAIVVCTRNRARHLDGCLAALAALDPEPREIIVVDNGSRDASTREVADRHGVECVEAPVPGLNRARNRGWAAASGAVVAYVDDDARADRRYAGAVARSFVSPGIGAVTGLVRPAELVTRAQVLFEAVEGGMGKGYTRQVFHRDAAPIGLEPFRCGVGTNMAIRQQVLKELDGFDERIGVGTATRGACDLDLFARVLDAGHTVLYDPDAVVHHVHRRTVGGLLAQLEDNGVSYPSMLMLHAREGLADARAVRRHLRRWHVERHIRRPWRALRAHRWAEVRMALAELQGSLHARKALAMALAVDPGGEREAQ
jgi:glycosyltransferase involved in cell wall biosynthesis